MSRKVGIVPFRGVGRRTQAALERHPECWKEGRLVTRAWSISLPEAIWAFINVYARKTGQTPGEVISFFAQEYIGIVVSASQRQLLSERS
jgi:hypothetical protein